MKKQKVEKLENSLENIYNYYVDNGELLEKDKVFINSIFEIMYNNNDCSNNIENVEDLEEMLYDIYTLYVTNNLTWVDGMTYSIIDDNTLKNKLLNILNDFLNERQKNKNKGLTNL